jgi:hypothetical protein
MFDDDNPSGTEQIAGGHDIQRAPGKTGPIRGIEKDDIETLPLPSEARQDAQDVSTYHPPLLETGHLDILPEDPETVWILFEKDHFGASAAQCLDAHRPRPSIQVKKPDPTD